MEGAREGGTEPLALPETPFLVIHHSMLAQRVFASSSLMFTTIALVCPLLLVWQRLPSPPPPPPLPAHLATFLVVRVGVKESLLLALG